MGRQKYAGLTEWEKILSKQFCSPIKTKVYCHHKWPIVPRRGGIPESRCKYGYVQQSKVKSS